MNNQLITKQWNDKTLTFREDGYFNMTKAAKEFGKEAKEFLRLPSTVEYMDELEKVGFSHVCDVKRGRNGGTWAHPKLAVFFARWLDTRFAVACDAMIEDILKGNAELAVTKPEQSATLALPQDYVSALEELAATLRREQEKDKEIEYMDGELNLITVDEYRALNHRYHQRGYSSKLGKRASKMARDKGIRLEKQARDFMKADGELSVTHLNVYPRWLLEEAEESLRLAG